MPASLLSATTAGPVFTPLADLNGGTNFSTVNRVSSNGLWAMGTSNSTSGQEAVRWSLPAGTALGIGDISNSPFSSAGADVTNNGLIATGRGTPGTGQVRIMRWISTLTPSVYNLSTLPSTGFAFSDSRAISNDGQRVVGQSSSTSGFRAYLWTAATPTSAGGTFTNLGVIALTPSPAGSINSFFSEANDISGDGLNIVGTSSYLSQNPVTDPNPNDNYTPPPTFVSSGSVGFIRQTTSLVQLADLTGGALNAGALAISDNKTRVAGFGTSANGIEGVIWSIGSPITVASVGDLAGGATDCRLMGLNNDGTRAVGRGTDASGNAAVIWNSQFGLRNLKTVLEDLEINVAGWTLTEATSISADGLVIAGNGTNPSGIEQAWVITNADALFLPPVPPVPEPEIVAGSILSFPISPDRIYQVRYSDNGGPWTNLGDPLDTANFANASTFGVHDPQAPVANRSYQVALVSAPVGETPPGITVLNGMLLTFKAKRNFVYQLDTSASLASWNNNVASINTSGDSGETTRSFIVVSGPGETVKFARVRSLNP
ncbi:MAG: hypothetical protein MUF31_10675 [Akkermansiaceae bacterium]|nr:hypothetical protein [Akkermansiaceae bacterium]